MGQAAPAGVALVIIMASNWRHGKTIESWRALFLLDRCQGVQVGGDDTGISSDTAKYTIGAIRNERGT